MRAKRHTRRTESYGILSVQLLALDVLETGGAGTVNATTYQVHLVVSRPDVIHKGPEFLEDICAHGEGDRHLEEEVPDLPGVWRDLEAGHDSDII